MEPQNTYHAIYKTAELTAKGQTAIWTPDSGKRLYITDFAVTSPQANTAQFNIAGNNVGTYHVSGTTVVDNLKTQIVGETNQPLIFVSSGTGYCFSRVCGWQS